MAKELNKHTGSDKKHSYELFRRAEKGGSHHRKHRARTAMKHHVFIDNTLACRHEIKYIVSEAKAAAIRRFIEPFLDIDHYTKMQPAGVYPIVSLYLDSADLRLCTESLEGHKNRFKLRIRSYTDDLDYPRFFEIKRRLNTIIIKSRARVRHQDIPALLAGLPVPRQQYQADENVLRQFQLYLSSIAAKPVVRIRYLRRAYEDDSINRVRVTFDRDLCYNTGSATNITLGGSRWQRLPIKGVILEIKFTGRFPTWLNQMVKCLTLQQQSVSKYTKSINNACLLKFCAPEIPMY